MTPTPEICGYVYIYIYIYAPRYVYVNVYVCIMYTSIYIYIYTHSVGVLNRTLLNSSFVSTGYLGALVGVGGLL